MPRQLNKAGSSAGAGYIVGTGEGFNLIEYMQDGSARSALGRKDDKPLYDAIDDKIMFVDITLGENDANKQSNHISNRDRNYPVASGYAKTGAPTYGDGAIVVSSGLNVDTNVQRANVKFEFATQGTPSGVKYSSLAT
jgi:hypothetical protein